MAKVKYTNGFSLSTAIGETRLLFLMSTPAIDGKERELLENVADIRMNITLAKQLRDALCDSISNYEKAYGEIVLPKQEPRNG